MWSRPNCQAETGGREKTLLSNIAYPAAVSNRPTKKDRPIRRNPEKTQKETLMSPEIDVGCGMSFSPMVFCQS